MVGTFWDCTKYEVMLVHNYGGSKAFTKIVTLIILPIDKHVNEYSIAKILPLKDVASITGVNIMMDSSRLKSVLMGYIIIKLDHIIPINLRTQLINTSWCKWLRLINNNLPRNISRWGIYQIE